MKQNSTSKNWQPDNNLQIEINRVNREKKAEWTRVERRSATSKFTICYIREEHMNNLTLFESPEFGKVRTVQVEGKPYFVAKDVAVALGYADATNAIKQHCHGGGQNTTS